MSRTTLLQERRMQTFQNVLGHWQARRLSALEAAEMLGMSERSFRRYRRRYEDDGLDGLFDRRLDKASARRVPADRIEWVLEQYRTRHTGWTVKHFHDHLCAHHGFAWSYTWTKTTLQRAGLVSKAPRRGAHRRRRPRKPCVGMMVHQDGSRHEWLAGVPPLDLIVTMDDATSEIYSAFLVEEEGTASTFRALKQVFTDKGLPGSLYTDRGSHYFHTPEAGGKVDKSNPTQVGRALHQLGIEHIAAYSPQARGRSERAFGTLQNRLVKELSLAGITEIEAANRFIADTYLPDHNRRFATKPELEASAFASPPPPDQVHEVLCLHTKRVVAHDNTVRHERRVLQIPASPVRHHYVKATVRVHEYPDGTLALFHGPRCLARYQADGEPIDTSNRQAA
jgi:transposase